MILESRILGRKKAFEPLTLTLSRDTLTLQELLEEVVKDQVEQFNTRQKDGQLFKLLTPEDLQKGLENGKITSGGLEEQQQVQVAVAQQVAITAFKDGLYYVFLGEKQLEDLSESLTLEENSRVMFVRLTPLVGG
ncbi:hypothetical protein [Deinococcus cellulosilyticus]|uniref:Uncharacterized protein n=1 Tax=Deinococcus cellulosilyticus (strain DSM 18568 / NBRC 106333 / KACC 11606 / 5516J-15) TaxID=1223518 RepID=A0A511N384_DEIC1|nr:hypothetical protein [Deinococcus cellulosilyticus]GEM46918.1 hypothetical protein DC3_25530 [Deinococcus cellulosilyticus NBRC 106333 = KACC 11606]